MKLPRDVSGGDLIRLLRPLGYEVDRQTGSHVRLTRAVEGRAHKVTIPNHSPIKLGTLNAILADIAAHLEIPKPELIDRLFG